MTSICYHLKMDIQKTALRLPKDLHQMVSESARLAGHSMNAEIIARLRSTFEASMVKGSDLKGLIREVVQEELAKAGKG